MHKIKNHHTENTTFDTLKNIFVIFLLSIYLISATELHQLFKLSVLTQHYYEHKEKDASLTLSKFLFMHYVLTNDNDGDIGKDIKLPFKSNDECNSIKVVEFTKVCISLLPKLTCTNTNFHRASSEDFNASSFQSAIWQPPKFS